MHTFGYETLPVRVFDHFPRTGPPGIRVTAQLEKCPQLMTLNLKLGIGMKLLDTIQWLSARGYIQLSAIIPEMNDIGWFDNKAPLYVVSVQMEGNMEIPLQSWCFGEFEYDSIIFNNSNNNNDIDIIQSTQSNLDQHQSFPPNPSKSLETLGEIPKLRMGTYITHLRSSLENLDYFPDPSQSAFYTNYPYHPHQSNTSDYHHQLTNHSHPIDLGSTNQMYMSRYGAGYAPQYLPGIPSGFLGQPLNQGLEQIPIFTDGLGLDLGNMTMHFSQGNHDNLGLNMSIHNSHMNNYLINNNSSHEFDISRINSTIPSPQLSLPINNNSNNINSLSQSHINNNSKEKEEKEITPTTQQSSPLKESIKVKDLIIKTPPSSPPKVLIKRMRTASMQNDPISPIKEPMKRACLTPTLPPTKVTTPPLKPKRIPVRTDKYNLSGTKYPSINQNVLNRAELKFLTPINEMIHDWNEMELINGRRLIKFIRKHIDNVLYCSFSTIQQDKFDELNNLSDPLKKEELLIISVIKFNDKYFITSVDLVYLLEGLLAVTFTLEEKNRIRRNLELFNPLTITRPIKPTNNIKTKLEDDDNDTKDDLFRKIMQFPDPKPRNIEKGIKVFEVNVIKDALTKVVGKHTASRSSTLKVNLAPLD